jgi:hypothetical protein
MRTTSVFMPLRQTADAGFAASRAKCGKDHPFKVSSMKKQSGPAGLSSASQGVTTLSSDLFIGRLNDTRPALTQSRSHEELRTGPPYFPSYHRRPNGRTISIVRQQEGCSLDQRGGKQDDRHHKRPGRKPRLQPVDHETAIREKTDTRNCRCDGTGKA